MYYVGINGYFTIKKTFAIFLGIVSDAIRVNITFTSVQYICCSNKFINLI